MKKICLILFLVLFLPLVFADPTYYFKRGEIVDIKVPCRNEGHNCNASTSCNISIQYPNGTMLIADQEMSWTGGLNFNYTLPSSSVIGRHTASSHCCIDSICDSWDFTFEVNNMGNSNENVSYIALIIGGLFIIMSIVLTIFFYSNDSPLRYMFLILDFLLPTILSYFCYLFPISMIEGAADLFLMLAIVFGTLTFIVIVLIMIELTLTVLAFWQQKKANEWKVF